MAQLAVGTNASISVGGMKLDNVLISNVTFGCDVDPPFAIQPYARHTRPLYTGELSFVVVERGPSDELTTEEVMRVCADKLDDFGQTELAELLRSRAGHD